MQVYLSWGERFREVLNDALCKVFGHKPLVDKMTCRICPRCLKVLE